MKRLKKGKVVAASLIVLLIGAIVGIIALSKYDKYAGLVRVNNAKLSSISTKLSANISNLTEENAIYTKGYDEVVYNIKYRLSEVVGDRDVIINAKISDDDPYASFKEVTGNNITSVLSSNRKEITITISNLPSNEEITSKVTLIIENAPKGYTVSPIVRIKESTEENYSNVTVRPVTVNTNSLQGLVHDEDGNLVPNILVSLKSGNELIKETYTNEDGLYTFSDITTGSYSVIINEEMFENLSMSDLVIEDGNRLDLIVKRVQPYKIETKKYITKVELNNLGTNKDYKYNDVELAQIPVKRVNDLHGKIYYKITVQNVGQKEGIISSVRDELPEGLSFDESLNSGYELKDGIIYNRNLEGKTLAAGEMITDTLVLTIDNTNVAKTYINQVNARGELYEHVVYLLNGSQYKTLDVLEGEKLDKLEVSNPNFDGWYTDEKLTNKYNYNLPVEKDLILYGVTKVNHTVTFIDKDPETGDEPVYDEQTVPNGEPVDRPDPDPSHTGYDFCGWDTPAGTHWDFNTPVTSDLTLTSCYQIKEYTVEFYDNSMNNGNEYELISTLTKVYKSTVSSTEAPEVTWEGHNFLQWTTDQAGQNAYDFTSLITGNVKLYAQYTLQDRLFIFNDENRITQKTVEYGSTVNPIADQGKEGHTFKHWSLEVGGATPFDFTTKIYQTTTVYAVYQINQYNVVFNDTDPWTDTTTEYDRQVVDHGSKASEPDPEPTKEGHTFCGWMNGNVTYDFDLPVTGDLTLTSCYTRNKVTVTFMDGSNQFDQKQIDYGTKVTTTDTFPTKEHNIFKYWSEDNTNAFDFDNTVIKQDKTLYSVYEEVLPPVITHTPLYWTNDKVLVTVSSTNANYSYKYKVDDGTYQDYTEPFELSTNSTIVAKSVYQDIESTLATHEVTNIDKLNPTVDSITPVPTLTSITINSSVSDAQSGIQRVEVYLDNVLKETVAGTAVNLELRDYTKTKDVSVEVTGLEANSQHMCKVITYDGAGNRSSEVEEACNTSTPDIVARIISIEGVPLPEEDYIDFPLLRLAIEDSNCSGKCTIQMVKSTNESVEILSTQDITLDLNGKTVAGVKPGYTVQNDGEFTLIDNADEAGGLINRNGIAVLNNQGATFTMGEGSSDAPSGSDVRVVSNTVPLVFGSTYGVYTETGSEFRFFDGKVKGADAVQGEVTETEYSYNATSGTEDEYEAVTLAKLSDPEARINKSVYYGHVSNAVGDAKHGTTAVETDDTVSFLPGFSHTDDVEAGYSTDTGYTFIYDPDNDVLYSSNNYYGSQAFTETIVDLTDYTENQILELIFHLEADPDGEVGKFDIQVRELDENYNESASPTYTTYGSYNTDPTSTRTYGYSLTAGKRYKVRISYTQNLRMVHDDFEINPNTGGIDYQTPPNPYTSQAKLVITSATLRDNVDSDTDHNFESAKYTMPGFYYDSTTDTIRSGNQYDSKTPAVSYVELDLTGKTGDYVLSVTASMESPSSSYGYVLVSDKQESPINSSSSSNLIYIYNGSSSGGEAVETFYGYPNSYQKKGPVTGTTTLTGGKKYYLNLGYYSYNQASQAELETYGISDQLIINQIKLVKASDSVEDIDIANDLVGNTFDDYVEHGTNGKAWYGVFHNNNDTYRDSYYKLDLTNSSTDKIFDINYYQGYNTYNSIYVTSNNRGMTFNAINSNRYNMINYNENYNMVYQYPYVSYKYGGPTPSSFYFEKGNVYYIHFATQLGFQNNSPDENYDCNDPSGNGYCGFLVENMKLRDVTDVVYNFGKYPINVGTEDYDSLAEDTNTINLTSDTLNPANSSHGYIYNSETGYYELDGPLGYKELASAEIEIDLENALEGKLYHFVGNYSNYDNMYTIVNKDVPGEMFYNYSSMYPKICWQTISYGSYIYLEPGHKYYFTHYFSGGSNGNAQDKFKIGESNEEKTNEYITSNRVITFNEQVDEIQILKDIDLVESMTIEANKETVLDLNGYKITSSLSTPVIDNYGKLTIIDSDYKGQTSENKVHNGELESSAGHVIKNEQNAQLIIEDMLMNIDGAYSGIYNEGNIKFESGSDSKIYVTALEAIGIYNLRTGTISDSLTSLEIIMNYNNLTQVNDAIYGYWRASGGGITHKNTGIQNRGYINISGLNIHGLNGRGYYQLGDSSANTILRQSTINVDINEVDKTYYALESTPPYTYRIPTYYYSSYYSSSTTYGDIEDFSLYIDSGNLSLYEGCNISGRSNLNGDEYATNGVQFEYVRHGYGSFFATNGTTISSADFTATKSSFNNSASVRNVFNITNGTTYFAGTSFPSTSVINNKGNNKLESTSTTVADINNYESGTVTFTSGSIKHIVNEGKEVTLSQCTVDNRETAYDEAIKNSGILNLESSVSVYSEATYGIYNVPLKNTQEAKVYSYQSKDGREYTYNKYTYSPATINIGNDVIDSPNISVTGGDYAITGPCYENGRREYYGGIAVDTKFISDSEGTRPIVQSDYDRKLCDVNFYRGTLKNLNNNDPAKVLDIPVSNTLDDSYAYWDSGLVVTSFDVAEAVGKTGNNVKIGSTYYPSIKKAVESVTTSDPVTIDVEQPIYTVSSVTIPEGKNITLRYNKYIYDYNGPGFINNHGNFTLKGTGSEYIILSGKYAVENHGTFTVDSGNYWNAYVFPKESSIVNNFGNATFNSGYLSRIDMNNAKNLTVNDGNFYGTMLYGNGGTSVTTLTGGNFRDTRDVPIYVSMPVSRLSNIQYNLRHMFELSNGATAIIDGYDSTEVGYNMPIGHLDNSTIELRDGNMPLSANSSYPIAYIWAENDSNVIVSGGTYNSVFINNDSSTFTMTGGTVYNYSPSSGSLDLLFMNGTLPKAFITGGTLFAKGAKGISVNDFKAQYYDYECQADPTKDCTAYRLVVGTKGDGTVSKVSPAIVGDYSVSNGGVGSGTGFLGFYDGIFKGISNTLDISLDEYEVDYDVLVGQEVIDGTTYQTKYLDQADLVRNNTSGRISKTFQDAFDNASDGDELETLREFTNSAVSEKITVDSNKRFSLAINHTITVNNSEFIENNGNVTITGSGVINSNVTGTIFTNNGTLTINDFDIINVKSTETRIADIIVNAENATLNINGSNITSLQNSIIKNEGTLNIDKNASGTSSCYAPTKFKIEFAAGTDNTVCSNVGVPIKNESTGTASINHLNVVSDNYCQLINNLGTMTINNSAFDQSSSSYNPQYKTAGFDGEIIYNSGTMSMTNIKGIFVPNESIYKKQGYSNSYYYGTNDYIYTSGNVTINNSMFDVSVYKFANLNGVDTSSQSVPTFTVTDSTVHSVAEGIQYDDKCIINLNDSTFNTKDSLIDVARNLKYSGDYRILSFSEPDADTRETVINIDGGSYTSKGNTNPYDGYYTPIAISYETECSSGQMEQKTLDTSTSRDYSYTGSGAGYMESYSNAITSSGIINVNDATIVLDSESAPSSDSYLAFEIYDSRRTYDTYPDYFGAIMAFDEVNIVDSTVESNRQANMGILGKVENVVVTLGDKDSSYDNQLPYITARTSTPISNATIKFYDGIIESKESTDSYHNTSINIDPSFIDKENGYKITGTRYTRYLTQEDVIKNITKDIEYTSVQAAISAASNNDQLKMLISYITASQETYTVDGKTLSIDLNGCVMGGTLELINGANVTITDSLNSTVSSVDVDNKNNSILSITGSKGIINTYNTSTTSINGNASYNVNSYDTSVVNISTTERSNNTDDRTSLYMYDSSTLNVDDAFINRLYLYNTSNYSDSCTTNAATNIRSFYNRSTTALNITCGKILYFYNGLNPTEDSTGYVTNISGGNIDYYTGYYKSETHISGSATFSSISNAGTMTIDGIDSNQTGITSSGNNEGYTVTLTITNSNLCSLNSGSSSNKGGAITTISNSTFGANCTGRVWNYNNSVMNIISGTFGTVENYYNNTDNNYVTVAPVMNIGTKNNAIDNTTPSFRYNSRYASQGQFGLKNTKGTINFYDGIVVGTATDGAIQGLINDIEDNTKISIFVDSNANTETAYLTEISNDDPRVAMVNGINYTSLQQAINKSVLNCTSGSTCPTITIYLNIELDADLTITDGYQVNIVSNGYTISTNGFNVPSAITLDGQPIVDPSAGGDIVNGIRNLLGINPNAKSVLVYEMSDGSALSTENHYRLYSFDGSDYELVEMERGDEVARYTPGNGITNMKPIKGRLYLTNLNPGDYKVSDDNGSEVTFTIASDGTLSGHVKEYIPRDSNIESTGTAKLIISIQTGIRKVNYMLIAISLIAVLSVMFVIKRKSQNEKNLV